MTPPGTTGQCPKRPTGRALHAHPDAATSHPLAFHSHAGHLFGMDRPILYSFRRCPYAMRARLALASAGIQVAHREILLRDKPAAMLRTSPKGTVPVLVTQGRVIDESLDIMLWALNQNDPEGWLDVPQQGHDLIQATETQFKPALDRYKYANRFPGTDPAEYRAIAAGFLQGIETQLAGQPYLFGAKARLPDMAILTFVRQFAHVDTDWFYAQTWPSVVNWLDHFKSSDRFQGIMQKHPIWVDPAQAATG